MFLLYQLNELVAGSLIAIGLLIVAAVALVIGFLLATVGVVVQRLKQVRR